MNPKAKWLQGADRLMDELTFKIKMLGYSIRPIKLAGHKTFALFDDASNSRVRNEYDEPRPYPIISGSVFMRQWAYFHAVMNYVIQQHPEQREYLLSGTEVQSQITKCNGVVMTYAQYWSQK